VSNQFMLSAGKINSNQQKPEELVSVLA